MRCGGGGLARAGQRRVRVGKGIRTDGAEIGHLMALTTPQKRSLRRLLGTKTSQSLGCVCRRHMAGWPVTVARLGERPTVGGCGGVRS